MKKGFTLIELLAVIVILAIIALIATPIVLDIINDAKQSSTLRSVDNILKGAELYVSKSLMDKKNLNGNIYEEVMKIIDGENPDSGNIYANKKGEVAFSFKYNDYCYTKGYEDEEIKVEKTDTCIAPVDYLMVANQNNGESENFFRGDIAKSQIEKIYTTTTNKVPSGVLGSFDVSEKENKSIMAWYIDEDGNGLYELYIGQDGGVKANPNSSKLFNFFINVVEMDFSNFDTSNATAMFAMFQKCERLEKLNLSNFNTINVQDMSYMFMRCNNLTNLNISNFNTKNVTSMSAMFCGMSSIENLDLSHFDTARVTDMSSMFGTSDTYSCSSLKVLNLKGFNTSNVTTMRAMFSRMSNIEELDLSNFDTSNVTTMQGIFKDTKSLKTLKLNKASFANVTTHSEIFKGSAVTDITVKDNAAKTFIEARLTDVGLTVTVTVTS